MQFRQWLETVYPSFPSSPVEAAQVNIRDLAAMGNLIKGIKPNLNPERDTEALQAVNQFVAVYKNTKAPLLA